jgi:hypothetical protein
MNSSEREREREGFEIFVHIVLLDDSRNFCFVGLIQWL